MTLGILSLTFNDLISLNRAKSEINTSKSETDPRQTHIKRKDLFRICSDRVKLKVLRNIRSIILLRSVAPFSKDINLVNI